MLDDMVGQWCYYLVGIGGSDCHDKGTRVASGTQTIDTILNYYALFGVGTESLGSLDVTVGGGLAVGIVFRGKYTVEEGSEFGVCMQYTLHLLLVAGGDDGGLDTGLAQCLNERAYALDVGVLHLLLKLVELAGDLCMFVLKVGKPVGIDALECGALDTLGKVGHIGPVLATYTSPEEGVLALRVDNDTIEVEECGFGQ